MKPNVFWGVLGGILLVWVILMVVVVGGRYGAYNEASDSLVKTVRRMKSYAKRSPQELPTERLRELTEAERDALASKVEDAREFYEERDARFEDAGGTNDVNLWTPRYSDDYNSLAERYREHTGSTDDSDPFPRIDPASLGLDRAVKEWRIQKTIIENLIAADGVIDKPQDYSVNQREIRNAVDLEDFDRIRVRLTAEVPASRHLGFIQSLLSDDAINFEIHELEVTKDRRKLSMQIVEQLDGDAEAMDEPNVILYLVVDALDWNPQPAPEQG